MLLGLETCEALGISKINVIGEVRELAGPTERKIKKLCQLKIFHLQKDPPSTTK